MHINITYSFLTYYVVMIHYHWLKVVGFLQEQNTSLMRKRLSHITSKI